MERLTRNLNAMFSAPARAKRAAPASTLVAIWPNGDEQIIERRRNGKRTIYCLGQQSSSIVGDLIEGTGARVERR